MNKIKTFFIKFILIALYKIWNRLNSIANNSSKKEIMKTIKLPSTFSDKEIEFIEEWYSEEGIRQLLSARDNPLKIIDKKPPEKGLKYVEVENVSVIVTHRDRSTLKLTRGTELKTVTLLVLDAWII